MSLRDMLLASGISEDQVDQMMAAALVEATSKARAELAKEQAEEAARKAVEAEARRVVREKRKNLFADFTPMLGDLRDALLGYVEPEDFVSKKRGEDGPGEAAGTGYKFGGELAVTLPDGTVKIARMDVSLVWDDTTRRQQFSLPATTRSAPGVLAGVTD